MKIYKHKRFQEKQNIWIFLHKLKSNLYLSQLKYNVGWLTLLSGNLADKSFQKSRQTGEFLVSRVYFRK